MKSIDAAFVVLHEAGRPLHYREITSQIIERNLWETHGKTPWDTVAARLGDDIRGFGEESRFVRSGSGMFGLNPMVATEQRNINRFLVQVNKDGGFANIINNGLYENHSWMDKPLDKAHGEVKAGDELVIYCTSNVPNHSMSLAFSVAVKTVSSDSVSFEVEDPVYFASPLKLPEIKDLVNEGKLPGVFRKCGHQGFNIEKLDLNSAQTVLCLLSGVTALGDNEDPFVPGEIPTTYIEPDLETIRSRIEAEGLVIDERTLLRFHLSLRTRGFVILSGISGTGKTWLAQAYARAVGGRELLVPVAPNWTTNEDLLGYLNPMSGAYHDTPFSNFLREAALAWESAVAAELEPVPHYLVLDEMNLARVEYYFATFLSKLEVRRRDETTSVELGDERVLLTPNLRFVGTVNVDETTHGFADKVYDRAQLVELEAPRQAMQRHLADSLIAETLLTAWDALHEVAPFAFRVTDDIMKYVEDAAVLGVEVEEALDEQLLQKLLPKVHGIAPRIEQALTSFIELCDGRFPLSSDKARRMRIRFNEHGSASYFA